MGVREQGREYSSRFADVTTNIQRGTKAIHARNHAPTGATVSPIKMPLAKAIR
jgi:hypothetical protein